MKHISIFFKQILFTVICLVTLSCTNTSKDRLPEPKIQSGIAKLTGNITNYRSNKGEENPTIILTFPNPVSGESGIFESILNKDGSFKFEVPVECNMTIGIIYGPAMNGNTCCVGLIPGGSTKIELSFDKVGNVIGNMVNPLNLTSGDIVNYGKMVDNLMMARGPKPYYNMSPVEFGHLVTEKLMPNRMKESINDSLLSKSGRNFISNECKLICLDNYILDYHNYILLNYRNTKKKSEPDNLLAQVPQRSFYTILKSFNLNDPQYLYNNFYPKVLHSILSNETLNIPRIKETPVNVWLKEVKTNVSDLVGFDTGIFYDLLVANAYDWQLNREAEPLSEKQKGNIKSYFKNEAFTKVLLKKNDEIIKSYVSNSFFKTVVNKTPSVPENKLMNTIISKYKGKAIVVDFWATWCGPCMQAMKEIRQVKSDMQGENITFVYITDDSSPKKLFEEDIKMIGGEQYYLTQKECRTIMDHYGFKGIPSYLFFDTKGVLNNKGSGYPGTEKMKKMIRELLP